jgi:aerobic-type carbon monoxide dehydrogenase small subunit (CoxS/CutS family)
MPAFKLHINGETHVVVADNDMPLLWVLRDLLGLTGTKYACGIGQCGACTVHVDHNAVRACTLSVSAVGESRITTIEGLAADGKHPLVEAWIAEQVPQCGYCQPGQIMAAAALLMENPRPTDTDINNRMAGNLCRCGTYLRIRRAIHRAARS